MKKWLELREREQWRALKVLKSGGVGGDREELIRITVWRMYWKVRVDAVRRLFSLFRQ